MYFYFKNLKFQWWSVSLEHGVGYCDGHYVVQNKSRH